jgi:hypothetical protein
MTTEPTPSLTTRSTPFNLQTSDQVLQTILRNPPTDPSIRGDRIAERQMEEPERWDGMG